MDEISWAGKVLAERSRVVFCKECRLAFTDDHSRCNRCGGQLGDARRVLAAERRRVVKEPAREFTRGRPGRPIEAFGERHSISEWSKIVGLGRYVIYTRLRRGWQVEEALGTKRGTSNRERHTKTFAG